MRLINLSVLIALTFLATPNTLNAQVKPEKPTRPAMPVIVVPTVPPVPTIPPMPTIPSISSIPGINETRVRGTITDASNKNKKVKGAQVVATCNGFSASDKTNGAGMYTIKFPQNQCKSGDLVTVMATIDGKSGSSSQNVTDSRVNSSFMNIDVAVLNVSVPEMGTILSVLVGVGSIGVFMHMRRKALV